MVWDYNLHIILFSYYLIRRSRFEHFEAFQFIFFFFFFFSVLQYVGCGMGVKLLTSCILRHYNLHIILFSYYLIRRFTFEHFKAFQLIFFFFSSAIRGVRDGVKPLILVESTYFMSIELCSCWTISVYL